MAQTDFYGYQRDHAGTFILSSDYASLYFANAAGANTGGTSRASLVQNATVSYQHNVQPRFEAGSSELYWMAGQAQGAVQCARLVGVEGILHGIQHRRDASLNKGLLGLVEFKLGANGGSGAQIGASKKTIHLNGCVLQSVGFGFSVGSFDVTENLTLLTALMYQT